MVVPALVSLPDSLVEAPEVTAAGLTAEVMTDPDVDTDAGVLFTPPATARTRKVYALPWSRPVTV